MIIYALVSNVVYYEQKEEIKQLARYEMDEHRKDLTNWKERKKVDISLEFEPYRTVFYYVISHDGQVIDGDETLPNLRHPILDKIEGTYKEEEEYFIFDFDNMEQKKRSLIYKTMVYEEES